MEVHYLNCGTLDPRGAGLFAPVLAHVPCLCLLLDSNGELVLVDTGFGTGDMEDPSRLGHGDLVLHARKDPGGTATRRLESLGFDPQDVGHIICTHLDGDHAGGLPDFPNARVHVLRAEIDAVRNPASFTERNRYRGCHFAHGPKWVAHQAVSPEPWFGMECIRELEGLPDGIALVPLPGHTRGHCGVAVDTGDGWVLHCGDAYYVKDELKMGERLPLGVGCFRRIAHCDYGGAMTQLERLNEALAEGASDISLIVPHDPTEYDRLQRAGKLNR